MRRRFGPLPASGLGRRLAADARARRGAAPDAPRERPTDPTPERRARLEPLLRRVVEHAAHDVNNHLQVMLGNAELLASTEGLSPSSHRRLGHIRDAGREAIEASAHLLALSRPGGGPDGVGERMSLGEVLERHGASIGWLSGSARWHCSAERGSRDVLPTDSAPPSLLLELVLQLALLARARAAPGSAVALRATLAKPPPGATLNLRLEIEDPMPVDATASDRAREAPVAALIALAALAGGCVEPRSPGAVLSVTVPVRRATTDRPAGTALPAADAARPLQTAGRRSTSAEKR